MRSVNTLTECMFTMREPDEFVPESHPLRAIRTIVNQAVAKVAWPLAGTYEADVNGGRPGIAPEKLLRAMLLQVLYSIRADGQLMEQTQYNLLFRWFIGLTMNDSVWAPTAFTKHRERLIKHAAVLGFFNEVLAIAEKKNWLSGQYFNVDATLIQVWAANKSFVYKDGDNKDRDAGGNVTGRKRGNERRKSTTDARPFRKTASELRHIGHTLSDNSDGLVVSTTWVIR